MTVELATAYVSLVPSTRGFGTALQRQITPQLEAVGRTAGEKASSSFGDKFSSAAGSLTRSAGRVLVGGLTVAAAAAGGLAATALVKGFGRLTAIDDAKAKLEGLGHSSQDVATIMDDALKSVKGTAFGLGDAATVAASTVAAGIRPGRDLQRVLGLTADAATIAGTSMGDMGAIFNKVAASNKLQGDSIQQLTERGIPIVQLLAKTMGISTDQVLKLSSAGKIGFAEFADAMEAGLGGAALKSGSTLTGALKNVGSALGRLGEGAMAPFLDSAKGGLGTLITVIDQITVKVSEFAQKLADSPGFTKFTDWLSDLPAKVGPFLDKLSGFGPAIAGVAAGLGSLGGAKLPFVGNMLGGINPLLGGFAAIAATSPEVRDAFAKLLPIFADVGKQLGGVLAKVLPKLVDALTPLIPVIVKLAEIFGDTFAKVIVKLAPSIEKLATIFAKVLSKALVALTPVFEKIADVLVQLAPTIGKVALVLGDGLAKVIIALLPSLPSLADAALEIAKALVQIITALLPIIPPLTQLAVLLIQTIGVPVLVAVATAIAGIATALATLVGWVVTAVGWVGNLGGVFTAVGGAIATAFSAAASWVGDRIGDIVGFITGIPGRIGAVASTAFDAIKTAITTAKNWVSDRIGDIVSFFTGIPERIGKIAGAVKDAFLWPFKAAFKAIANIWNDTVGSLSFSIPDWVPGIGGDGFDMPKIPTNFHTGGVVPGRRGQEVPAMLLAGETVFTPRQMAALGHAVGISGSTRPFVINQTLQSLDPSDLARQSAREFAWTMATSGKQ